MRLVDPKLELNISVSVDFLGVELSDNESSSFSISTVVRVDADPF